MPPKPLHTARLVLRAFQAKDVPDVLAYADDPEYARFIPVPQPYLERDAQEFVDQASVRPKSEPMWAIEYEGRVQGAIELYVDGSNRRGELHYAIARPLWGRGLTTEAVIAVIRYAFSDLQLNRLFASPDVRNVGSWRVLEKAGMRREGVLRSHRVVKGEPVDDVVYAILREEFDPGLEQPPL